MAEQACYCTDTSALIELHATYGSDVFVSLWQKVAGLVKEGRLIAPREVLREIEKKDDDLLKWVKKYRKIFREQEIEQVKAAAAEAQRQREIAEADRRISEVSHDHLINNLSAPIFYARSSTL